jgi:uncharacterized protein (UPF0332 family)
MGPAPFDWSGYFELAGELGKRSDEASHRTAISRAYYFIYHIAIEFAETNIEFKLASGEPSHKQVWRLFSNSEELECQRLASIADRIKEKRIRADYDPIFVRLEEEVPSILASAQDLANRLVKLDPRHLKAKKNIASE